MTARPLDEDAVTRPAKTVGAWSRDDDNRPSDTDRTIRQMSTEDIEALLAQQALERQP